MLTYDPVPWLMSLEGMRAVRSRRMLGIDRDGDAEAVDALERELSRDQLADGSFDESPMKTAGVLNLLDDLKAKRSRRPVEKASSYLFSVLERQPGYDQADAVKPGNLKTACDLGGFFGPYDDRNRPEVIARGAREMNLYREYEPLLGPKSPVRGSRRSTLDQAGPGSCYAWGLIPLCYIIEALCRAGYSLDARLRPAVNALLGAQRESGGWCRNLGGHPSCTIHAVRCLGTHTKLRRGKQAQKVLSFMRSSQRSSKARPARGWKGSRLFAAVQAAARFDLPLAREFIRDSLKAITPTQRKNGTFGGPCQVEKTVAVLVGIKALG